ncbi:MAG: TolC family protein [Bacteroidales bacterium]|nr:TolC family protein [Bacteroidales bacterium]MBR5782044.1 TolC family protein [Bacteroidales bacterium]
MKKSLLTLLFALSINTVFAQYAYQNILSTIEANSTILAAHHKQMEANMAENNAYALVENPEIEAGYIFGYGGESDKIELGISQEFDFPTVYSHQKKIIKMNDNIICSQYDIDRIAILTEAQAICTELIFCKTKLVLFKQNYDNAVKIADAYQKMMEVGEVNILDYNKSKINLANAKNNYDLEMIHHNNLMASLKTMNGGKDIEFQYEDYDIVVLPENFDEWYANVEQKNPVFEQMRQQLVLDQQKVKLSKAEWLPKFSIGYGAEIGKGNEEGEHGPSIGLVLPLWHNKGSVKSAKMHAEASETLLMNEKAVTYNHLSSLFAKAKALQENVSNLASSLEQFDGQSLLLKAFVSGEINLVDYLNEVEYYQNAMIELYSAQYEMNATLIELKSYESF